MFAATPLPVALETVGVLAEFEPAPLADRMQVAALFVHGADDKIVPVAVSRTCAESAVHGELRVVDDCGHLVPIDQADVLGELLVEHLGRLQG